MKCPFCSEKKALMSLLSGNTIGAKIWSDMKQMAPMLPRVSPVQKCPKCGCYYLEYKQVLEESKNESFERGDLSYSEWKEAYRQFCIKYEEITIDERCFLFSKKKKSIKIWSDLDEKDWNNVRLWLIQAYNDNYYREGLFGWSPPVEFVPPREECDFIVGIINDFIESFDWTAVRNPLLKAELYRESHQFEECKKTLETIDFESLEDYEKRVFEEIKTRNDKGDVRVFRILSEEEWRKKCEIEIFEKKKREQEGWVEQENKDNRYKCCKIGHCYENIKSSCPWCVETDVFERVDENTPIENIDLYLGHPYGSWVLTTDPNIEGKSDRIRKITIDRVGGYKLYYHLDGQTPNPFCNNSIKLGDKIMKGSRLVELCDKLIDGGLNKLLL